MVMLTICIVSPEKSPQEGSQDEDILFHQWLQLKPSLPDLIISSPASNAFPSLRAIYYGGKHQSCPHSHYYTSSPLHQYCMADQYRYSRPFLHKGIPATEGHDNCLPQSEYAKGHCSGVLHSVNQFQRRVDWLSKFGHYHNFIQLEDLLLVCFTAIAEHFVTINFHDRINIANVSGL